VPGYDFIPERICFVESVLTYLNSKYQKQS
jgi:hypothetical protein